MKLLLLSRYSELGASSRTRFYQYLPFLDSESIIVDVSPFFSDSYLKFLYRFGHKSFLFTLFAYLKRMQICFTLKKYDLVWVEKECFPMLPAIFEKLPILRNTPYVLDYDDAIHHNYDANNWFIKLFLSNKLRSLVSGSTSVVVGNKYLLNWAKCQGAKKINIIPTTIDLRNYDINKIIYHRHKEFRVGWIGMPATTNYLWLVHDVLKKLSLQINIRLVLIGAGKLDNYGLSIERHEWSESSEFSILSSLDVGIMPLTDSNWERGKCGYKLIQYMACLLPVVASPVGANQYIVENGINGFLASNSDDWEKYLIALYQSESLRIEMGRNGRKKVEQLYSLQSQKNAVVKILKDSILNNPPIKNY